MLSSRFLAYLIIPLVILGLGIWAVASMDVDRGSVKVAGAMISAADIELTVNESYFTEDQGVRKLVLHMDARNNGNTSVEINPLKFQVILTPVDNPITSGAQKSSFSPMYYRSICDADPYSMTSIPAKALRSYTLHFYAVNLPRGEEWDNYFLNLEYYDPGSQLMLSKPLNPEAR